MGKIAAGWRIQRLVVGALRIRELVTRLGRQNIGFLWMMVGLAMRRRVRRKLVVE